MNPTAIFRFIFILHPIFIFLFLAGIVAACGLTMLINPFGLDVPRTWIALLRSPVLPQVMAEHRPLLSRSVGWTVLLFGGVYLSCLLGSFPCRPRVVWLFPLVWFILAWTRIRHGPLFAIVAVIALADMFPHIRWVKWLARQGSVVFRLGSPGQAATLGLAVRVYSGHAGVGRCRLPGCRSACTDHRPWLGAARS